MASSSAVLLGTEISGQMNQNQPIAIASRIVPATAKRILSGNEIPLVNWFSALSLNL
jgi:hypothetical protein